MITDLVDYLNNNLLIAHYCGFDISAPLPSYWTFDRFLKQLDNDVLSSIMKSQVLYLSKQGIVDTSFIGLDSTPIAANTSQNNPKSFLSNKFKPDNQPKADTDCKLGVHTASNQTNEKKYEYITIPDDLRLSVDRDSKYFKSNYSLRTECERYNSRFKNTGQERMWVRNKSSVTNLNTIAHISLLAVAVAAITTGTGQSYRKLKAVKRIA